MNNEPEFIDETLKQLFSVIIFLFVVSIAYLTR